MNKRNWTLLAISFAGDNYLSPAQLQKSLFLLKQKKPRAVGTNFYKFIPYNYGPFCKDIYLDAELLASKGLIKIGRPIGKRWAGYSITDRGKEYLKSLEDKIAQADRRYLCKIINWIRNLTFMQLLSIIYRQYPEYKVNSVFI